jgi:hypothetical protein
LALRLPSKYWLADEQQTRQHDGDKEMAFESHNYRQKLPGVYANFVSVGLRRNYEPCATGWFAGIEYLIIARLEPELIATSPEVLCCLDLSNGHSTISNLAFNPQPLRFSSTILNDYRHEAFLHRYLPRKDSFGINRKSNILHRIQSSGS